MDQQDLQTGLSIIRKDFSLSAEEFSIASQDLEKEAILKKLTSLVDYLLNRDFEKLLLILYRIDISEDRFKAALASNEAPPAQSVAALIFEREMQKVETRKKYSQ